MKLSFCIFAVVALFGGASSDVACMMRKVTDIALKHYLTDTVSHCHNIELKFERAREGLKTCTRHEIDIDGMESLLKEFCSNGSDFRRGFDEHRPCLHENYNNSQQKCESETFRKYGQILRKELRDYERAMEMCNGFAEFQAMCMNENVAKPCGEGAVTVYKRMTESAKPLIRTVCLEAGHVRAPSDGDIDIWFGDDDIWVPASATSHSATRWSIALGVSIAMVGAECLTFAISNVFGHMCSRYGAVHLSTK